MTTPAISVVIPFFNEAPHATGVVAEFREPILLEKVLRAASTARSEVVLSWAPGATKRR